MINWHALHYDQDVTWKSLIDALDLGSLPSEVRSDIDRLVFGALQGHGHTLAMGRGVAMLNPSSLVIPDDSLYMDQVAAPDVDYAYEDYSLSTALNGMFDEMRRRAAELRCVCLEYYVRMG